MKTLRLSTDNLEIEIKEIKTINNHFGHVNCVIVLKDKRIASCSYDGCIRIFNPLNNFSCELIIDDNFNGIRTLCQLDNSLPISCSFHQINVREIYKYTFNSLYKFQSSVPPSKYTILFCNSSELSFS